MGGLTDDSLQHASSCQLRSCQLQSLQRRFDQQQKIVTPSIEKIESNIGGLDVVGMLLLLFGYSIVLYHSYCICWIVITTGDRVFEWLI